MISLTKNNNIYIVTLENSPVNALSLDFVAELSLLIREICTDESTRGLLINSSLEHFCAGADLKERSLMTDAESINTSRSVDPPPVLAPRVLELPAASVATIEIGNALPSIVRFNVVSALLAVVLIS